MTLSVNEEKAVDTVDLDLIKACDSISHSIVLEKMAAHGLDRCALYWVKKLVGWLGREDGDGGK